MVAVKIQTIMNLAMSLESPKAVPSYRRPLLGLTRKNLKPNSLCGSPKARNQRETASKLTNSR